MKLRTTAGVALALSALALTGVAQASSGAASAPLGPAVFFSPHQDDETLSMGASIVQHVRAGRQVYVVLMTDGGSSRVASRYPSRAVFVAERDREFVAAVTRMGAIPVIRPDRETDGLLTTAHAQAIIQEYVDLYPTGSFKTMSEFDASRDHYRLGQALRATGVKDARWYIKRTELARTQGRYTAYENLRLEFLDYQPVGWLSVALDFKFGVVRTRDKIYQ